MFIFCTRVLMGLLWSLMMSSSGLEGSQDGQYAVSEPLVHFFVFIKVSADSPETKNSPNFL
jgi:hypothetical protein